MNPGFNALIYLVWFCATFYVVYVLLLLLYGRKELFESKELGEWRPSVSVIVPAYNEERSIAHTIESLKQVTYEDVEFIVISDGSTDGTARIVRENLPESDRFRFIDNQHNQGKAKVLNEGVALAKGQFVACMDADSMIDPDIFEQTLPFFKDEEGVGAVTVSVEVANGDSFLNKIYELEYIIGLSLFLKVFSFIDSIFVTPGPFTVFRRSALEEVGGFDPSNITEDLEIAYRLQRAQYKIRNCLQARVRTFVPETFMGVYRQRRRWYAGAIQTLFQHHKMLFRSRYGLFGYIMPFNYLIIACGLALFASSLYMTSTDVATTLWNFQYTGFNFLDYLWEWDLDLLRLGSVNLIGITAFLSTIVLMVIGLGFTKHRFREKKVHMLGYPLLFFLYQLFWWGAIYSVVRGKKISWR